MPQDIRQNCEAVTPSRISEKSLLCNVSMNTCLDDHASQVGSVFSTGTLPLQCVTQHYIASYKTILVLPAHGYSNNPKQKSYLHFGHKKYYMLNRIIVIRRLLVLEHSIITFGSQDIIPKDVSLFQDEINELQEDLSAMLKAVITLLDGAKYLW